MSNLRIIKNLGPFSQLTYAGFCPGRRSTFLSGKVAKTIDASLATSDGTDARGRADQLARLKQGPQDEQERPPLRPD